MRKMKLSVRDLTIGMYVADLDRPWLDSPFPFQGFPIKTEHELAQIRQYCDYVYVDVEHGLEDPDDAGGQAAREKGAKSTTDPNPGAAMLREPDVTTALPEVTRLNRRATHFMRRTLADIARGKAIDAVAAGEIIEGLNSAVSLNVNVALWLTLLRHEHEETASHCVSVSLLALAFARHLGYQGEALQAIGMAGLLHDVGLIKTPKAILDKTEPLSTEEVRVIRQHVEEGVNLLEPVPGIPSLTLDIIRQHHERVDGSGYPAGLSGKAVAREAQLLAIADMYESMVNEQAHARPMSPYGAISVIRRSGKTGFDNDLVDGFIRFIGIYPISTLVQLNNQAIGMVVGHTPQTRLRPVLIMLIKPNGEPFRTYPILNLAESADEDEFGSWQITQVLNPDDHDIDLGKVTAIYLDQLTATPA